MIVKDKLGNPITPGCTVVYAVRAQNDTFLRVMRVTQVQPDRITGHNPTGRIIHVKNLETMAVAKTPEVRL